MTEYGWLELLTEGVTETIATTFSFRGEPNIAPMGVYVEVMNGEVSRNQEESKNAEIKEECTGYRDISDDWNEDERILADDKRSINGFTGEPKVEARLFEGSTTYRNVNETERVTVNLCNDPVVYAKGAVGDFDDVYSWIQDGHLSTVEAWIDCDAVFLEERKGGDLKAWKLEPRNYHIERRSVTAVDRGFNSIVEAAVHATRLSFKPELRELVEHHLDVAENCGGRRVRLAAEIIEREALENPS
ncbi:MAG: DUF447 domain-containing protein [Halobacteria archaeon]